MDIVSSPAKKLEAAMARLVLRGVFPKKDIAGGLDPPVAAPVDMVIVFIVLDYWCVVRLSLCATNVVLYQDANKLNHCHCQHFFHIIFHLICTRDWCRPTY